MNTAITKKSLEFATHQPAEFTPGDIVYLDGKAYWVNDHGQIIPLNEAGFKPGDIVYKDGKPYIVDANGQLKPFSGKLAPGQRVYQNGKWYAVDELGNLNTDERRHPSLKLMVNLLCLKMVSGYRWLSLD